MADERQDLALLQHMINDPNAGARVNLATWVAQNFASGRLPAREQMIAQDILGILVRDAAENVRVAIAEQIKACHWLPHDLAGRLARDVESVSLPILEYCQALLPEDLLSVLAEGSCRQAIAIARRENLTEEVCDAICDRQEEPVLQALFANLSAPIPESGFLRVLKRFESNVSLQKLMVQRPQLPLGALERLIDLATDDLLHEITKRHDLPIQLVSRIALLGREKLLSDRLRAKMAPNELDHLTDELRKTRRLTPTLIFRGLLLGEHAFFVKAIALLAEKDVEHVDEILEEGDVSQQRALLLRAGMPMGLMRPIQSVLELLRETRAAHQPIEPDSFFKQAVTHLCANFPEFVPGTPAEIMDQALRVAETGS